MINFPNCIPQDIYKPDEYLEPDLVSDCCGAFAINAKEGERELCSLCGRDCLIVDANKGDYEY